MLISQMRRIAEEPGRSMIARTLTVTALIISLICTFPIPVSGQEKNEKSAAEKVTEALTTLKNLLELESQQQKDVRKVLNELNRTTEDSEKKRIQELLKGERAELESIRDQITAMSTGVSNDRFNSTETEKFNLQVELEQLVQPFVVMLKSATEDARQIERLRRGQTIAERNSEIAQKAVDRINPLIAQSKDRQVTKRLKEIQKIWTQRLESAEDLATSFDRQLESKLRERTSASQRAGQYFTEFFRSRGFNFSLGLLAFFGVFFVMRLAGRASNYLIHRRSGRRSLAVRFFSLIYQVFTVFFSIFAMLIIFNMFNDWLLLGLTMVFLVALVWLAVRMIPNMLEQITLLLNLGAVQEGERVLIDGVPWLVERLDFYTDLRNPALAGGEFTVPVRQLSGLHSRPTGEDEAWFPSKRGDWVRLNDGRIGQVAIQTPEIVQITEMGGEQVTYPTNAYLEQVPMNLSNGYRLRTIFGIDYKHQAEATDEIPEKLQAFIQEGLEKALGPAELHKLVVTFLKAGASSLDYEVEAQIAGRAADRYEDVEREIARLLIAACNKYGWVIPFEQLVLHQAA